MLELIKAVMFVTYPILLLYILLYKNNKVDNNVNYIPWTTEAEVEAKLKAVSLEKELNELILKYEEEKNRNEKILHQKKSFEVKNGMMAENSLSLLREIPYDSVNLRHLGEPIDYIYFDFDGQEGPEITFIEVKTGRSRESTRQKLVKRAIMTGKIHYEIVRIDENGVKIKRSLNEEI